MAIDSVHLQQFRSYGKADFTFSPNVNIIVGPNASGKTNLLESVLVIARGSSYRVKDAELIAHNAPWARLEARLAEESRVVTIEHQELRAKKQFKINGQVLQRLMLPKMIPVVIFEPNHLQLLSGSPEMRRQFLDDILEQTVPSFGTWRRQYKRILAQRNALLKSERFTIDQLFVWNLRLSEFGERIALARFELIQTMQTRIMDIYSEIAHTSASIQLTYALTVSHEHYASELLRKLEAHADTDRLRGFTTYGPHREDLLVSLNGHIAQETASRGEMRTILLVFKIMEATLLEEARNVKPLMLLDDVFSELDQKRRQALTNFLQSHQTFITTTDADVVTQHFQDSANIISLTTN